MTDDELRDKLAKEYAENECYVTEGVTTHADSFAAGWDAAREHYAKVNFQEMMKTELYEWASARHKLRAMCEKLAEALMEADGHFNAIMSGLTTDLNDVERLTKKRAYQAKVETSQALAEYRKEFGESR